MAQLLVRDIDDAISRVFNAQAHKAGKSPEMLARELITRHTIEAREAASKRLDTLRTSTVGKIIADPVDLIRSDRDNDHAG